MALGWMRRGRSIAGIGSSAGQAIEMTGEDRDKEPSTTSRLDRQSPRRRRRADAAAVVGVVAAVAASAAYFLILGSLWLDRPGLYMDETNFVQAALGGHFPHQLYVYEYLGPLPFLIIPYAGTVKAAIFAPIFAIWGVSTTTVRLPALLLSVGTLVVSYFLGREVIGRWSALFVACLATCPTFVFMSKVDWGPIAVAMFLTAWMLLAFYRYMNTGHLAWLWVLYASALVGVFDKQNFLWLLVAVAVGALALYRKRLLERARARVRGTLLATGLFAFGLFILLLLTLPNLSSHGSSALRDPFSHLAPAWELFQRTAGYSEVVGFFTGQTVTQPLWTDLQWVLAGLALGVLGLRRLRGPLPEPARVPARAAAFFSVVFVVMMLEVAATKQATGPHHVIALVPYPVLVVLCSLVALLRAGDGYRTVVSAVAAVWLGLLVASQAYSTAQYVSLMRSPNRFRTLFSTAVYQDAAWLNANSAGVEKAITADWGPGTPLFALACPAERHKYRDDAWSHFAKMTPDTAEADVRKYIGDGGAFVISVHDVAKTGLPPGLRTNFGLLIEAYEGAYPGQRPQRMLTTPAYDITYFGPHPPRLGSRACGSHSA